MRADRILACLDQLDDEAFNFAVSRLDMDTVTAEELRALRDDALRRAAEAQEIARRLAGECLAVHDVLPAVSTVVGEVAADGDFL